MNYGYTNPGYLNPLTWQQNYNPYPPTYSGTGSHIYNRQPTNNLLRVTGPESAKSYPIGANSSVVLFDANDAVFYLKTTDDSGFASIRTFDFVERTEPIDVKPVDPGYATKDDLDCIRKQLSDISEALKGLM